jgi:hypothetical protein
MPDAVYSYGNKGWYDDLDGLTPYKIKGTWNSKK